MNHFKKISTLTLLSTFCFPLFAGLFKIENRSFTNAALEADGNALLDQLENEINKNFPQIDAGGYLRAIGNATVTAGSGIGADYQNPFKLFVVGVQGGLGVDPGTLTLNNALKSENASKIKGIGIQAGLVGGLNLSSLPSEKIGFIPTAKAKLFFHILPAKKSFKEVTINVLDVGTHYQYQWIDEVSFGPLLRWNGVSLTTGLSYSKTKLNYTKAIAKSSSYSVGGTPTTASFSGDIETKANIGIFTVPLEISSAVRLLYFLQFFGGLGADLNYGTASGGATLANSTFSTSPAVVTGTPTASLGAKKGPNLVDARYFVGTGLELFALNIYGQFTQSFPSKTYGLNVGVKAFW